MKPITKREQQAYYRSRGVRPLYLPGEWTLGNWLTRRSERRLRAIAASRRTGT